MRIVSFIFSVRVALFGSVCAHNDLFNMHNDMPFAAVWQLFYGRVFDRTTSDDLMLHRIMFASSGDRVRVRQVTSPLAITGYLQFASHYCHSYEHLNTIMRKSS